MITLIILLVLAVLAAPVIAVIALVSSIGFNDRIRSLEHKIAALEKKPASPQPRPAPEAEATLRQPAVRAEPPIRISTEPPLQAPSTTPAPPATPPSPPPQPVAASVPSSPLRSSPAPSAAPAPPRTIGFEESFGTRWVVWVGGVALALGGIFLVRYTIEQGLIGPRVRIMLGAVLALALVAAGEWQRRSEKTLELPSLPSANIPAILTAAGTTVAYATVYAAYAIYDFLPPPIAFVLLGAVALLVLGRRFAARTRTRRSRHHRRLSGADAGRVHRAGLLVALYLHRRRQCSGLRIGALSAVARARAHGARARRAMGASRNRS